MKRLVTMVLSLMLGASLFADNELVVGDINMSATVDQIGGASITIPIEVPAGVNGMQPNLALVYNSHSGYGLAGWGWDLAGISTIQRTGSTYFHDSILKNVSFTNSDNLLLDGERLLLESGQNLISGSTYKTEHESFNYIRISDETRNRILVTNKEGVTSYYESAGYILNNCPAQWTIRKTEDVYGNYMTYSYFVESYTPYVNMIEYTQKDDDEGWQYVYPAYQIYFYYTTTSYKHHYYIGDKTIMQDRVLSRIDIVSANKDLYSYRLEYNMMDLVPKLVSIKKTSENGDYYSPTTIVWSSSEVKDEVSIPLSTSIKSEYLFGDFNGDGKADIFSFEPNTTNAVIHYNNTDGGVLSYQPTACTLPYNFVRLKTGDYNADGRMDLIGVYSYNSEYRLTYLLSNGTTFASTSDYVLCPNLIYVVGDFDGDGDDEFINQDDNKLYSYGKTAASYPEVYLWYDFYGNVSSEAKSNNIPLDFNGDGKNDVFCYLPNKDIYSVMEYDVENARFSPLSEGYLDAIVWSEVKTQNLHFGDFNGDGKTDIIYVQKLNGTDFYARIYLSDGTKFIYDRTEWVYNNRLKIQDFNGDGLSDIAYFYPDTQGRWHLFAKINTGGSFVDLEGGIVETAYEDLNESSDICFYDMYGLGFPNMLNMEDRDEVRAIQLYDNSPLLVEKAVDGLGNNYLFTYKNITDRSVYTNTRVGGGGILPLVNPFYVVSDFTAPYTSLSYHYKNGRYHTQGKGLFGFEEVTTTDNLNQTRKKDICYITAAHLCYYPYSTTTTTIDGDTISYLKYRYTVREMGGVRIFPHHSGYEYTDYLTGIKETVINLYDNNGNLDYQTKTRGDWMEYSKYYYTTAGSWCPNRLDNTYTYSTYNGETSPYRRAHYRYDNHGNMIRQVIDSLNANYRLVHQYAYDDFGNVTQETISGSGQTRTRTYTYSADGRFQLTATDELGQTVTNTYDSDWGTLLTQTTNAGVTTNSYDVFGRLYKTVYPDSTIYTVSSQFVSGVPGVRYMACEARTNAAPVTTYYNAAGKPLYTMKMGHNDRQIYTALTYYPNGVEKMVSEPYFSTSVTAAASQSFTSDNATLYTYDEYQRPSRMESPEGTTSYAYSGLTTIANTPTVNQTTKLNSSGFTEYEQVGAALLPLAERPGLIPLYKRVYYTYYPTGQVKTATPDGGSAVSMEYDIQGNRTKLIDPDAGSITNTYNAFGQVLTRSQNVHGSTPVVTAYEYEASSGRLTSETMVGDTTISTTYSYNSIFKNKPYRVVGQVGKVYTTYMYDEYGNEKSCLRAYFSQYGRLATFRDKGLVTNHYMLHAGLNRVYYGYDSYGNMTDEKLNSTIAWELLEQNARGQVVRERKGGVVTTYTYDNCGRMTSIVAPNIVSLHYTYDAHGNVLTKTDAINNQSIEYSYDHLMRLVSWTVNDNSTQSVTYDATTGNIISKTDLGASAEFSYDGSSKPHALRGVSGVTGTDWGDTDILISYADFSKVKSIQRGNDSYNIFYGVEKERFRTEKIVSGSTTTRYYMPNHELVVNSLGEETYIIYLCNGSIAVYDKTTDTETLYHGYYDAQGSLIALTDNSGNVLARYAYDPWGKRVKPTDWTQEANAPTTLNLNRGYTMHEHLDEFDLINMNGRVYDPAVAQFLSPDPYIQDAGNWLNYNRYAYCYNNPTRYVDPSGEVIKTLVLDFFNTLFTGGLNFGNKELQKNAWRKFDPTAPWSKTNKAIQIDMGLFKTDPNRNIWGRIWQLTSRFTWELPQTVVGYVWSDIRNMAGQVDRVDYYGGATFVTNENSSSHNGVSIGSYININLPTSINDDFGSYITKSPMYMHEYGHYIQSQYVGPKYFSFIGFPSLFQTIMNRGKYVEYNNHRIQRSRTAWMEVWANKLAADYFMKAEGVDWGTYENNHPRKYFLYY